MLGLLVLCLTVGLVDSINPTTVGPALYLATVRRVRGGLVSYTVGIFAVNFLGGLLITLGPGQLILSIAPHPKHEVKHLLEIGVGAVAAATAVAVWYGRRHIQLRTGKAREARPRSAFVLGATITAFELPTAFPYFAVIAAIIGTADDVPAQVGALVVFNVAFTLPLLVIIGVIEFAGERAEHMLERFGNWFLRNSATLLAVLLACVAIGFFTVGAIGLIRAH